jgi:protein TilB
MTLLDEKLIRQKSEHHDGLLSELEEIALHQLDIIRIENIGTLCRNIRILLLQNNKISRIENIHRLKELEYLNLGMNEIHVIENLRGCESLRKLDLMLNLIRLDRFEESISNLAGNYNLEDLYLMGNPVAVNWTGYRQYVIGRLPSLKQLDGQLITPSERQEVVDRLPSLVLDLQGLAKSSSPFSHAQSQVSREPDPPSALPVANTPSPIPPPYLKSGELRQCNVGRYNLSLEHMAGRIVFRMDTPRFMDISLIDVDVQPEYIRVVVRGKLTQVKFDAEIIVSDAKLTRSKSTGEIRLEAPILGWVVKTEVRVVDMTPPPLERVEVV